MLEIVRLFENGSVNVSGLRGTGKDMLMANVIAIRGKPYISNVNYGGDWTPLDVGAFNIGNSYRDFLDGTLSPYVYPYPDGMDVYTSDSGLLFPSQYSADLDKRYPYLATVHGLLRQLGECSWHTNSQRNDRVYNKIREQSDTYIVCNGIFKPLLKLSKGKLVLQVVTIYSKASSAQDFVPPYPVPRPILGGAEALLAWSLDKAKYDITYGKVKRRILFYINRSAYDTRIYKKVLERGSFDV